jgi:exoribonuclease-2
LGADYAIQNLSTKADSIRIAANLRHETLEPLFNEATIGQPGEVYPFRRELEWLYGFARHLEIVRGKADQVQRNDYVFKVDGEHVDIVPRVRGNPDRQAGVGNDDPGQQPLGRHAGGSQRGRHLSRANRRQGAHDAEAGAARGLGVAHYTWSTSPLRRYVDLAEPAPDLAVAREEAPPHAGNDPMLFAAVRDFELAYDAYNEFQRGMERYWCLRWMQQEGIAGDRCHGLAGKPDPAGRAAIRRQGRRGADVESG